MFKIISFNNLHSFKKKILKWKLLALCTIFAFCVVSVSCFSKNKKIKKIKIYTWAQGRVRVKQGGVCSCRLLWIRAAYSSSSGLSVMWTVLSWNLPEPAKQNKAVRTEINPKISHGSAVANGGNTSAGLTHTSVGSQASALREVYTQIHKCKYTSARPQLCSCDSSPKSDNLAAERKGTCLGLPRLNCCSVTLDHLSHIAV